MSKPSWIWILFWVLWWNNDKNIQHSSLGLDFNQGSILMILPLYTIRTARSFFCSFLLFLFFFFHFLFFFFGYCCSCFLCWRELFDFWVLLKSSVNGGVLSRMVSIGISLVHWQGRIGEALCLLFSISFIIDKNVFYIKIMGPSQRRPLWSNYKVQTGGTLFCNGIHCLFGRDGIKI